MDEYSFISENGTVRQIRDLVAKAKDEEQDERLDYLEQTAIIDTYSETETQTNKRWIDGKPIFRRVAKLPAAVSVDSSGYTNIGISFPANAETMFAPVVVNRLNSLIYYGGYKPVTAASIIGVTLPAGTCVILEYTKV